MQMMDPINPYDGTSSYTEIEHTPPNQGFNLYGHDTSGAGGHALYAQQNAFTQPVMLFRPRTS